MKPQHIDLPRHVTGRVRPSLARAAYLGLALLVACPWPPIAHAQFTCAFTQITDSTGTNVNASINSDGTRIAFRSTSDLTGNNPDGNTEIFLWIQGSGITQITNSTAGDSELPSINSDGARIAFSSTSDLTGNNPDGNREIFLWIQGSGITQITDSTAGDSEELAINGDGTRIAFRSTSDLTGNNPDGNTEIFLWIQGSGITQITDSTAGASQNPSINSDGTRIAFSSTSDLTGNNSEIFGIFGNLEIFLWTQGSGITQITDTTGSGSNNPSINGDGTRIAFTSLNDLTGGNPDGNFELFLWIQGTGITQITDSTAGNSFPSINGDGTRIAFQSSSDLTGGNADGTQEIFLWIQGSGITQITDSTTGGNFQPSINGDGTRIAFRSTSDLTGGNPDGNSEIFLVSCPGGSAPMEVLIDIKPGSDPNSINPRSRGVIPVAILTTETFDASTVDTSTVEFGPNGAAPVHAALEDVDGDGDLDLILHFRTQETGISCGDTDAVLTGETTGGQAIEGSDAVNTVGCP